MGKIPQETREQIKTIIADDYDECQFFTASAQLLTNKIKDFMQDVQEPETTFEQLRDEIGQIGIFLSNAEKRLQEVEDCYTKLVETISKNIQRQ